MPELIVPTAKLHAPFLECRDEWGPGPQEDGEVLGGIALRHHFDDDLGQIGYGIRPSARRRGLATWALGEMLAEARVGLSVDRVLAVCLADNVASARTLERCGGVIEGVRDTERGPRKRYWITV